MKAALLYGPEDLRIEEVDRPSPGKGEVLIKVRNVGICPSDIRVVKGIYKRKYFDYGKDSYGLSGHEWSGEVVEIGDGVDGIQEGDNVVPEIIIPCGTCRLCKRGKINLCINKKNILRGYAEYAVAPARNLFKIPRNVSFEEAALTEPLSVCLRTNDIISPKPEDNILIIGCGPIGLLHLQVSKLSGANIMVSDILEERLNVARKLGADLAINPSRQDIKEEVLSFTDGYGADAIIVSVGGKAAMESALRCVAPSGIIVEFAGTYPPESVQLDLNLIHYGEVKITGSYDHLPGHMERALRLLSKKLIDIKSLISHTVPLEKLQDGLRFAEAKQGLKVIVKI